MNVVIDDAIYRLQSNGGISSLWRALQPFLQSAMPDCTFDAQKPADVFISTYYQQAPQGVKSIAFVYDFIHERFPGLANKPDSIWKQNALKQADAAIAISQWTADDAFTFTHRWPIVAYPATSLTRASHERVQAFKSKYGLPDSYVLIVGRRGLYKNVSTYWQALKLMNPRPFTACIGGETEPLPSGIRLSLDTEELEAAYTGATCLVYPSLYEGFGLPVLEAYACGCPVICGDGGALKEINGAASVVNVTRPLEIAQALIDMHDHGKRIEHIMRGYIEAKRFTWETTAQQIAAVIRQVAESSVELKSQDSTHVMTNYDLKRGWYQ